MPPDKDAAPPNNFIRRKGTNLYLMEDLGWTQTRDSALGFHSFGDAVKFVLDNKIGGCEYILTKPGGGEELLIVDC